MAIIVTCPGCRKSFSVRDEFAGKKGPCPKCKTIISIPAADKTVKVHGGEAFSTGGRNAAGVLVLKPIKRLQSRFSPILALQIAGGVLVAFVIAWFLGGLFRASLVMRCLALLVITPPLAYGPYFFLRDSEAIAYIEVHELKIRTALCSVSYLLLWAGFAIFAHYMTNAFGTELWIWLAAAIPFIAAGIMMGGACYNLETGDGALHFMFYLLVTLGLAMTAGVSFTDEPKPLQLETPTQTAPQVPGQKAKAEKEPVAAPANPDQIPEDPRK